MSFEMPTSMVGLTADPPEDITILRVVGDYSVAVGNGVTGVWNLALLVQDQTWTPAATINLDNDKRILWQQQYTAPAEAAALAGYASIAWYPPTLSVISATTSLFGNSTMGALGNATHIDIAPKVRLEAGKALYLVAYEGSGTSTLTSSSVSMRVLFQRSRRR